MFKKLSKLIALVIALVLVSPASPARAGDCEIKTCIEVYVKDGRLVIEGRRGSGPTSSSTTPAQSLFDKLVESIPTSGISYQPSFSPLVKTPVYFWSDVPTVLTKRVKILDEIVDIKLKPNFIWHYGDGVIFATRDVGAAFPDGKIQHTYSRPGHYLIELVTHWSGEFTVSGVSTPIPSELISLAILPISVVTAPIRFVN
jgi:hypothetical protein